MGSSVGSAVGGAGVGGGSVGGASVGGAAVGGAAVGEGVGGAAVSGAFVSGELVGGASVGGASVSGDGVAGATVGSAVGSAVGGAGVAGGSVGGASVGGTGVWSMQHIASVQIPSAQRLFPARRRPPLQLPKRFASTAFWQRHSQPPQCGQRSCMQNPLFLPSQLSRMLFGSGQHALAQIPSNPAFSALHCSEL